MTGARDSAEVETAGGPRVLPLSYGPVVGLSEGEMVPVSLTVEAGDRLRVSIPVGAFTQREGRALRGDSRRRRAGRGDPGDPGR